jgi:hypothetical protein
MMRSRKRWIAQPPQSQRGTYTVTSQTLNTLSDFQTELIAKAPSRIRIQSLLQIVPLLHFVLAET